VEITISKTRDGYCADIAELPGSPPIGLGNTKSQAVVDLLFRILHDSEQWKPYIKDTSTLKYNMPV